MTRDEPNWEGLSDAGAFEHRTVGPHRAWCYTDSCWCYPDDLCGCCGQIRLPEYLRGLNVGDAVAAERERIYGLLTKQGYAPMEMIDQSIRDERERIAAAIEAIDSPTPAWEHDVAAVNYALGFNTVKEVAARIARNGGTA